MFDICEGGGWLPVFNFERWKNLLEMIEERGAVEFVAARIGLGTGQGKPLAGTSASDVAVEPFVAETMADRRAKFRTVKLKRVAFEFVEQWVFFGRRGKHAFVETEHEREFKIRIARAIYRADEHLIERGRNDADGEIGKARFENG